MFIAYEMKPSMYVVYDTAVIHLVRPHSLDVYVACDNVNPP